MKDQLFHSNPLFSSNNILEIWGQNYINYIILFSSVNPSTGKSLLYFMIGLHFQEAYVGMKVAGL